MRWFWLVIPDLIVSLLAYPLAPLIVLFTNTKGKPPVLAFPWLTYDNPIDGDGGHWERWPDNGTRLRQYSRRVAWLWRNRGYNFSYHVTGVATNSEVSIRLGRAFWKDERPRGFCFATCGKAWMLFIWLPYSLLGLKRGLRVYLGWKLRNKIDKPHENSRAMLVTHINPFKGKM